MLAKIPPVIIITSNSKTTILHFFFKTVSPAATLRRKREGKCSRYLRVTPTLPCKESVRLVRYNCCQ
jgi:hypothetical protein